MRVRSCPFSLMNNLPIREAGICRLASFLAYYLRYFLQGGVLRRSLTDCPEGHAQFDLAGLQCGPLRDPMPGTENLCVKGKRHKGSPVASAKALSSNLAHRADGLSRCQTKVDLRISPSLDQLGAPAVYALCQAWQIGRTKTTTRPVRLCPTLPRTTQVRRELS